MRYVLYTTHIRYCVHMYSSTLSTTLYVTIGSLALALRYCTYTVYSTVHEWTLYKHSSYSLSTNSPLNPPPEY